MPQNERERSEIALLRRRIAELEERVEQDRSTGERGGPAPRGGNRIVGTTPDGRLVTRTRCLRCDDGVLVERQGRLTCTACGYDRYL